MSRVFDRVPSSPVRAAISVTGIVQGIGFRPYVFGLATKLGLFGWVRNGPAGVSIEIEGQSDHVDAFLSALRAPPLPGARVDRLDIEEIDIKLDDCFVILPSEPSLQAAGVRPTLPPDTAPCAACLGELNSPGERRYRYPFTNCAHCGPRLTIASSLPYDRMNTTLRGFTLCEACAREYQNPQDRRFHAQPIACPACGPAVYAMDIQGKILARRGDALQMAAQFLQNGKIVALKGVGGFQLLADACDADAVRLLRRRKQRPDKALAVMFASLGMLRDYALISAGEAGWLGSPEAPIVLVERRPGRLCDEIAFQNPWIGAMLPSSPLHCILMELVGIPIVCTSGNLRGEPICTEDAFALSRLGSIADMLLSHDRPIARPVDDSVVRVLPQPVGLCVLRRARGFCPGPIMRLRNSPTVLALGAHLKNTIALCADNTIVMSQHLGDLDGLLAAELHERTADEMLRIYDKIPEVIACDLHPDYQSSRLAERLSERFGARLSRVQHHHAHIAAVVAEHSIQGPVLGLAWDGLGLGDDGQLWGGEAMLCEGGHFKRVATLRSFPLPGGEKAVREGRRAAAGLLFEVFGDQFGRYCGSFFEENELSAVGSMLRQSFHSPRTTSIGRLFDAVCALAGGPMASSFEGQAAMHLEFAAAGTGDDALAYPLPLRVPENEGGPWTSDIAPLVEAVLADREEGRPIAWISARFHAALAALALEIVKRFGENLPVVLSGGCFQNVRLLCAIDKSLREEGFQVFGARYFPANDGGISLGQGYIAAELFQEGRE